MKTNNRTLINNFKLLQYNLGLNDDQAKGKILASGLSFDTAARLLQGSTNFSIKTLARLANEFNCEIRDIIDLEVK